MWSLHVLPVSDFFPQSKDLHVRLIGLIEDLILPIGGNVSVCGVLSLNDLSQVYPAVIDSSFVPFVG